MTVLGYIGPGAGFAFVGSFLILLTALFLVFLSLLSWPFRLALRPFRYRKRQKRKDVRRVIVLGLDGLDPGITRERMAEGRLPHLKTLAEEGTFTELESTCPPISPVAWSSFSTGSNPGKHNIFDFLNRDLRTYIPVLSSSRVRAGRGGRGKGSVSLLRKSKPFWTVLGEHGVFSTILRVPITFPPEKFNGLLLSAMCVPDLRGTQGTFTFYSSDPVPDAELTGGTRLQVEKTANGFRSHLVGPAVRRKGGDRELTVDFRVELSAAGGTTRSQALHRGVRNRSRSAIPGRPVLPRIMRSPENGQAGMPDLPHPAPQEGRTTCAPAAPGPSQADEKQPGSEIGAWLHIDGQRIPLVERQFTDWVRVGFRMAAGRKVYGICKFYPVSLAEPFRLYCSPINIDPEKPALPISHPAYYALYLAKLQGAFATLGIAEDTWAVNEGLLSEQAYLDMVYDLDVEREAMFFESIRRTRKGLVTCVFDTPDRIQHMFYRYREPDHPANRALAEDGHAGALEDMYDRMDALVGRTRKMLRRGDVLIVLSDHGFTSFRRGVNLNAWLRDEGYLFLKDGADGYGGLGEVDWQRTRAYTFGLSGVYLNQKGREAQGIVEPSEAAALRREIAERLRGLKDPATGEAALHNVHDRAEAYSGPYAANGPDLITGYAKGYRASWDAALGRTEKEVFSDNVKAWSGDHSVDRDLVPGVLFTSRPLDPDAAPRLIDIGPTILRLFGVPTPAYMDGSTLTLGEEERTTDGHR